MADGGSNVIDLRDRVIVVTGALGQLGRSLRGAIGDQELADSLIHQILSG